MALVCVRDEYEFQWNVLSCFIGEVLHRHIQLKSCFLQQLDCLHMKNTSFQISTRPLVTEKISAKVYR